MNNLIDRSLYFSVITEDSLMQARLLEANQAGAGQTLMTEPGALHVLQQPVAGSLEDTLVASRSGDDLLMAFRSQEDLPVLTLEQFFANDGQLQILRQDGELVRGIVAQDQSQQGPLSFSTESLGSFEQQAEAPVLATLHQAMFTEEPAPLSLMAAADQPLRINNAVDTVDALGRITELFSGDVTDDKFAPLQGTGPEGAILEILDGAEVIGEVKVGPGGDWTFEQESALAEGGHVFTARVKGSGETSNAFALIVDSIAPSRVIIEGIYDDREGLIKIGGGTQTSDSTPLFKGTAEKLSVVEIYNGKVLIGTARANSNGEWTFAPPFTLPDGDYNITARASDYSGNTGLASTAYKFSIDTTPAPAAIARLTSISEDTGSDANDFITRDATLVFNIGVEGDLRVDERVQISFDKGVTWLDAQPNGRDWVYDNTTNAFAEGSHDVLTRVVNGKGKTGDITKQNVVVDTTAPADGDYQVSVDNFIDDVGSVTGTFPSGSKTDDTSPLLQGKVSGLQSGDEVHIYEGQSYLGKAHVNGSAWTYQLSGLSSATYNYRAVIVDRAGNLGEASDTFTIVVDLAAPVGTPSITQAYDDVGLDQGWLKSGARTDDTQPQLTGQAEPDGVVHVYLNGIKIGSTTANATGSWTFDLQQANHTLDVGKNIFTARNVSITGTESADSLPFTLTVESTSSGAGGMAYGGLGYEVANAGDFNGDGIDDFIVTAPANQYGNEKAKKSAAYIVYGTENGLPEFGAGIDKMTADQGIKIDASKLTLGDYQNTGIHARGAGDFNGDGYDDIIIGSHFEDGAHIIYGRGDGPESIQLQSTYDPKISTGATRIGWGSAWSAADIAWSDVNADGYADAIVSDSDQNKVYIIYGGKDAQAMHGGRNIDMEGNILKYKHASELPTGSYSVINENKLDSHTSFGDHLNSVGDVNGDGLDDFVVTYPIANSAEGKTYAGSAFLLFGQQGGFDKTWTIDNYAQRGIRLSGTEYGELLGDVILDYTAEGHGGHRYGTMNTVSTLGDINGDGVADFIIGSPDWGDADTDGNAPGRAYVVFGKKGEVQNWSDINLGELNGRDGFILQAKGMGNAQLGNGVMGGFDFNGDGIDDFLVGAPNATLDGKGNAGASYLVFGQKNGVFNATVDLDQLVAEGKAVKWSGNNGDRMGTNHAMGDWNGDGIADIAIPSWMADPNGKVNAGSYMIQYGETAQLTHKFTAGDDAIVGRENAVDRVAGGMGNDTITGVGVNDVVYGGSGNDTIALDSRALKRVEVNGKITADSSTLFTRIDGGLGIDTLILTGSDKVLNIGMLGERLRGIEQFDLGSANNVLQITQGDVVRLGKIGLVTDSGKVQLLVEGSGQTSVELLKQNSKQQWVLSGVHGGENGKVYDVYTDAANTLELFVPRDSATLPTAVSADAFSMEPTEAAAHGNLWMLFDDESSTGIMLSNESLTSVHGGSGNDVIGLATTTFTSINGGDGVDTLLIDAKQLSLDMDTLIDRINSIEKIDLGQGSGNTLKLSANALDELGQSSNLNANGKAQVVINGDDTNSLQLLVGPNESWVETGTVEQGGIIYDTYVTGLTELLVEQNINVSLA
ncbi:Ig-like domain-containing protein [Metapseudomonas furukawaii]